MTEVPADLEAEESILGAMMLSRDAIEAGVARLVPADFYRPAHATIFGALKLLWDTGRQVDPVTVAGAVAELGAQDRVSRAEILRIQAGTPASSNSDAYIEVVVDRADRRRLLAAADRLRTDAADLTVPVDETVDAAQGDLGGVLRPGNVRRFPSYAEWAPTVDMHERWVVPGVLERRDRVILVAPEGAGKSHLFRQWGIMVAAGIHWFTERRMEPASVLIIDVENSDRQIVRNTAAMERRADLVAPGRNPDLYTIIPVNKVDLTSRADRLLVESYIAGHRPAILVIGPLYKILPPPGGKVSYEEHAMRGVHIIDDWRARYDIAVLIEHHAPKGSGGRRDLDPLGSSAWMRWPEFGLKLQPSDDDPRVAHLGHFRGQRERRAWPKELERGGPGEWPWRAPSGERASEEPF